MATINMLDFKRFYGLPENMRDRTAVNAVIRNEIVGGAEVLAVIERMVKMQHGREKPDDALQDMLDRLTAARDKMAETAFAKVLAAHVPAKKAGRPQKGSDIAVDWSDVDWSMGNSEIGRIKGVTRQAADAARKKHAPSK